MKNKISFLRKTFYSARKVFCLTMIAFTFMTFQLSAQTTGDTVTTPYDSTALSNLINGALQNYGNSHYIDLPLVGHMSYIAALFTLLMIIEVITRLIPGATPFSKVLVNIVAFLHEHLDNKGKRR